MVFSNFRFFLFSLYLRTLASRSIPHNCVAPDWLPPPETIPLDSELFIPNGYDISDTAFPSGTTPTSSEDDETCKCQFIHTITTIVALIEQFNQSIN